MYKRQEPSWGSSGLGYYGGSRSGSGGGPGPRSGSGAGSGSGSGGRARRNRERQQSMKNNHLTLAVGDRVNHAKYGLGTVTAADGSGPRATVTIDFGSAGTVRLMLIGGVPMEKL